VTGTNTSIWTELIKVYRTGTSPVVARTLAGTISPLDIQQGFTDAGLNTGDSFKWDLVASNTSGDSDPSDFSNTILIPAPIEGLPDPQSISAAAIGPDAIFVQWEYGTSYYTSANLDWSTSDSGPWNNLLTGIAEGVLSYLHNSLDADTEYSYRLTLVDAGRPKPTRSRRPRLTWRRGSPDRPNDHALRSRGIYAGAAGVGPDRIECPRLRRLPRIARRGAQRGGRGSRARSAGLG